MNHIPVLLDQVSEFWHTKQGGFYVDGTLGFGGHTKALLTLDSQAYCLGLDRDMDALHAAVEQLKSFGQRVVCRQANYKDLAHLIKKEKYPKPDGILLDLGVSSMQLDEGNRGFSFQKKGPLDMRMDAGQGPTVLELIHRLSVRELADVIWRYGEEKRAKAIAAALKQAESLNALTDTLQCAEVIAAAAGRYRRSKGKQIHPATKTFQALRIAVNQELESLHAFLAQLPELLNPNGRALFISFHSLEDRMIKNKIREWMKGCVCPPSFPQCVCGRKPLFLELNRKPIVPSLTEMTQNPRSRSAKLRVIEKI